MTGLIALSPATYPDQKKQEAFYEALLERARSIPGVERAALVSRLPMTSGIATATFTAQDRPVPPGQEPVAAAHHRRPIVSRYSRFTCRPAGTA